MTLPIFCHMMRIINLAPLLSTRLLFKSKTQRFSAEERLCMVPSDEVLSHLSLPHAQCLWHRLLFHHLYTNRYNRNRERD